ncbi:carbohydrate ABC transporter permease [Waltera sp.]|uniref:carbohydrate ABC transporter permease n=1 Tax=Waltera sp. TaxID=2815806 RepID=UPI003AB749BE
MKRGKKKAWFYSMPFLIIVGLMIVVPLLYTVEISFTNMSIYHWKDYHCVGLDNYKKALLAFDSGFLPALLRTLLWTVSSMALQLIFGFFVAVGLNAKGLKLRRVYKTLLIVPWAMPAYVSILLWRMGIFNTEFGLFNQILKQIGGKTVNFLSTNGMAFISCLVVNLWLGVPYMFTMMDGAMQSIDRNIYESAELDGAGFWKKHFYVTIPQILPILMPVIIMATFTAFKQFDIVYLMTMQTGSKTGADINTVITYVYEKAFITSNYGYSSAVAFIVFVIILVLYKTMNRREFSISEQ